MSNPLLSPSELPPFASIEAHHAEPAIREIIERNKEKLTTLLAANTHYTWDNLLAPLETLEDVLAQAWSPVSHLNSVRNDAELRAAYNACLPLLSEYGTWMGQHEALCAAYQQIADSPEFAALNQAQRKTIDNALRDFRLAGVALPQEQKQTYGALRQRLSELSSKFGENVLDATNAWTKEVTAQDLSGLPESAMASARQAAEQAAEHEGKQKEEPGYLINLEFPSYMPVMTYCDNRALREEVYIAYATRASELGPHGGQWDNTPIIEETLQLRQELAALLGFNSYAELSLATKMAKEPTEVTSFLQKLAESSQEQAQQEWAELQDFARTEELTDLQAWDVNYYSEKLRQQRYAVSQEDIRPYLPVNRALEGLFEVARRLYGVTVAEVTNFDTYHEDVRLFDVLQGDAPVARFYLDLYARGQKRGGAWMDDCRVRRNTASGIQLPVAYLVCNFTAPIQDQPALLTHTELTTLFHEFGHGLHHMLTQQSIAAVSGINGVPWDAVELPSQFLENWCWEREALAFISGHHASNEPLPEALLDKLLAARNFQAAMAMVRQLEFSLFDFRLHLESNQGAFENAQTLLNQVRDEVGVVPAPAFNRLQNGFSHIFSGGYAAGYYSYKWAEVLSADAFSRFEEDGIFNENTGADFRHHILEAGGSMEPMELFKAFRGREPSIDALLRHSGIAA